MALEEAIEMLRGMQNKKVDYAEMVRAPAFAYGYQYVYPEPEDYVIEEAISALKEVQQYREIGTVEECREAVDKQKPKKPIKQKGNCFSKGKSGEEQHEIILICPLCGGKALKRGYPCKCGQAIQWDEDLEDIENGT